MFDQLYVTVAGDRRDKRGPRFAQVGSSKKRSHEAKGKQRVEEFELESEELLQVITQLREASYESEKQRQVMRVELARLQKECQKQHAQLAKLLASHAVVPGATLTEIRQDIEKSTLVRQLKAQVYQLRSEYMAKQTELEKLRDGQKASHLIELTAENEEFFLEIQRLRKVVSDLAEDLRKERQDRKSDQATFTANEKRLRGEVARLTNERNKLISLSETKAADAASKLAMLQPTLEYRENLAQRVSKAPSQIGSRARPRSAIERSQAIRRSGLDNSRHEGSVAAPVSAATSRVAERPKSAISRISRLIEPVQRPERSNSHAVRVGKDAVASGPLRSSQSHQPLLSLTQGNGSPHNSASTAKASKRAKSEQHIGSDQFSPRQSKLEVGTKRSLRRSAANSQGTDQISSEKEPGNSSMAEALKQAQTTDAEVYSTNLPRQMVNHCHTVDKLHPHELSTDAVVVQASENEHNNNNPNSLNKLSSQTRAHHTEHCQCHDQNDVPDRAKNDSAREKSEIVCLDSAQPNSTQVTDNAVTVHGDQEDSNEESKGNDVQQSECEAKAEPHQHPADAGLEHSSHIQMKRNNGTSKDDEAATFSEYSNGHYTTLSSPEEEASVIKDTFALLADMDNDPDFTKYMDDLSDDDDDDDDDNDDSDKDRFESVCNHATAEANIGPAQTTGADRVTADFSSPSSPPALVAEQAAEPASTSVDATENDEYDADFDDSADAIRDE